MSDSDSGVPLSPHEDLLEPDDPSAPEVIQEKSTRYLISSYGSDMPVESLVRRFKREDIYIPPFQRKFVWNRNQASRFVESLLLGLPVPGIFLFREPETRKLMVVDGQQRIVTLSSFYSGVIGDRKFTLSKVSQEFAGKAYLDLDDEDRRVLDDAIVHATIFHQDRPSGTRGSVYSVFERLNTGGSTLRPQEIRSCVYRGSFIDILGELAQDASWRRLWGRESGRKEDEEIILRFLALHNNLDDYKPPMKRFLNDFTELHRNWRYGDDPPFVDQFRHSVRAIADSVGPKAFRPEKAVNLSVADAILCGVAQRLHLGAVESAEVWVPAWEHLLEQLKKGDLVSGGTAHSDRVKGRIRLARRVFGRV